MSLNLYKVRSVLIISCVLLFNYCIQRQAVENNKPNFIIIFTDDQGYQDLGSYGSPNIKTPNIDQLAAEGMKFTSFYAQTVCGPSRSALMTGCYPLRVARNDDGNFPHPKMSLSEITIAELLKTAGYTTGMIGKWDLAGHHQEEFNPDLLPFNQGFDFSFFTPSSNDQRINLLRNKEVVELKTDMSTLTRRYTDEAIDFITDKKEDPFFLYLAHTMPHTKLAVSEFFRGKSEGGLYGDAIEEIDFNVGRLMMALKENGQDKNTYVIFTSDNGPWHIRGENGGHAEPLRGAKTSTWEGGLRVPCIIRAPGKVASGSTTDLLTATIDLLPTIARLADVDLPEDRIIDGLDVSDIIHGNSNQLDRPFFYYQHKELRAVRMGKWKLHLAHPVERTQSSKKWMKHSREEDRIFFSSNVLYDLDADIGETKDLAADHPEIVETLLSHIEWARNDIGDYNQMGVNARPLGKEPFRTPNDWIPVNAKKQ